MHTILPAPRNTLLTDKRVEGLRKEVEHWRPEQDEEAGEDDSDVPIFSPDDPGAHGEDALRDERPSPELVPNRFEDKIAFLWSHHRELIYTGIQ